MTAPAELRCPNCQGRLVTRDGKRVHEAARLTSCPPDTTPSPSGGVPAPPQEAQDAERIASEVFDAPAREFLSGEGRLASDETGSARTSLDRLANLWRNATMPDPVGGAPTDEMSDRPEVTAEYVVEHPGEVAHAFNRLRAEVYRLREVRAMQEAPPRDAEWLDEGTARAADAAVAKAINGDEHDLTIHDIKMLVSARIACTLAHREVRAKGGERSRGSFSESPALAQGGDECPFCRRPQPDPLHHPNCPGYQAAPSEPWVTTDDEGLAVRMVPSNSVPCATAGHRFPMPVSGSADTPNEGGTDDAP